jgi:riboflavin kinase/FMN adenylyltransferase
LGAKSVITIGNFDGVHVGHAALVRAARDLADRHAARVVALAFDPHPMTVLKPEAAPARLMPFARRAELLLTLGADEVHRLEPTAALLAKSPEEFIRTKVQRHGAVAFVEGYDFHFGKGRAGNNAVLAALGRGLGFEARVVDPVQVTLTDHTVVTASSSLTRWLLSHGRARDAAVVLGRPHEIAGVVGPGDRRGRTIGFPTANLHTSDMLPADGVYAAWAVLADLRRFPAAVNIGPRPTFAGMDRRVEAHLIGAAPDASGPNIAGLPEYNWPLRLELTAWVRDQVRFESVAALVEQLHRDAARAATICHNPPPAPPSAAVHPERAACR